MLWIAHLFGGASYHGVNLLPLFITSRGGSAFTVGILMSVAALAGILARPALGRLIDARGRRIAFVLSGALNVTGFAIYLSVDSLGTLFVVGRLLHGIGLGGMFVTFFTAASDLLPVTRRARGIALFGISGLAAAGVGPVVGELALRRGGFDALFVTLLGFATISWLMTALMRERRTGAGPPPLRTRRPGDPRFDPAQVRVLAVTVVFGLVVAALMTFLPPYMESIGVGPISVFFVAYAGTSVTLRLIASSLPDRIGYIRTLFPTIVCLAGAAFWIAVDPTLRGLVAAGILGGTGHAFAFPTLTALVLSRADDTRRGVAVGGFTAAMDTGVLVAGPALGFVATQTSYGTAFVLAGLVAITSVGVFLLRERAARALALVPLVLALPGATWVSPAGDDGAAGTEEAPRRTIEPALAALAAGDTLFLLDGVYDVANQGNANLFGLAAYRAGNVLAAAPGAAPVVDFTGTVPVGEEPFFDDSPFGHDAVISGITFRSWTHDRCLIRIDDADGVTVTGCTFEAVAPPGATPILEVIGVAGATIAACAFATRPETSLFYAIALAGDGGPALERYTVRDCVFNDAAALADPFGRAAGILATGVDSLEITGCAGTNAGSNRGPQSPWHFIELRDVDGARVADVSFRRHLGDADGEHPLHDADGIKVGAFEGHPSTGVRIERCELWGAGHGIHVGNDSHAVQLAHVWCDSTYDDCVFVNDGGRDVTIEHVVSHYSQDNGIDIQGDDVTVRASTIVRSAFTAINVRESALGVSVRDLLVYDVRDDTLWPRALVFVEPGAGWSFDHDAWFDADAGPDVFRFASLNQSFAAWQGAGQDANGFHGVDPGFCDPMGRAWPIFSDAFRPAAGSPIATGSTTGGPIGGINAVCASVHVGGGAPGPGRRRLVRAVPNPAPGSIRLEVPAGQTLVVTDVTGRRVRTLAVGASRVLRWDGRDARGVRLPPGVYFLSAPGHEVRGRVVLAP